MLVSFYFLVWRVLLWGASFTKKFTLHFGLVALTQWKMTPGLALLRAVTQAKLKSQDLNTPRPSLLLRSGPLHGTTLIKNIACKVAADLRVRSFLMLGSAYTLFSNIVVFLSATVHEGRRRRAGSYEVSLVSLVRKYVYPEDKRRVVLCFLPVRFGMQNTSE